MAKKKITEEVKDEASKQVVVSNNNFSKLRALTGDLNKRYGRDVIKMGDKIPPIRKVPFNEPALDYVYDGGIALGRFIESLGKEHSGKTRNALKIMGNFQKFCFGCMTPNSLEVEWEVKDDTPMVKSCKCNNCKNPETRVMIFADLEGTTDPAHMERLGVDVNGVMYFRVDMPSQAVDIIDTYLREPSVGLIVLDSVGAMGSDSEVEKSMEDIKMNQNAMFLNRAMRKWQMSLNSNTNSTGKENGTTLIVINQSYQTLDLYSKEVAQGGRGLRHGKAQSVKTDIIAKNVDKKTNTTLGVHIRVTNEKNKTGMPYRRLEYYLNLDPNDPIGYCQTNLSMQYAELAILLGVVEQRGAWFYFGDTGKWQGKADFVENMSEDIVKEVNRIIYKNEVK